MDKLTDIRCALRRNLAMVVGICLCLYFSYHLVAGNRSYSYLSYISSVSQQKAIALQSLEEDHAAIATKVEMMRPDSLSVDMLEEQSRFLLGYNNINEFMILGN